MFIIKRIRDLIGKRFQFIKRFYETQREQLILYHERIKWANKTDKKSSREWERLQMAAIDANRSAKAKLEAIHTMITFSYRVAEAFSEFEHKKAMNLSEIQEKEADIYIKQAKAKMALYEAKLSELKLKIGKIGG